MDVTPIKRLALKSWELVLQHCSSSPSENLGPRTSALLSPQCPSHTTGCFTQFIGTRASALLLIPIRKPRTSHFSTACSPAPVAHDRLLGSSQCLHAHRPHRLTSARWEDRSACMLAPSLLHCRVADSADEASGSDLPSAAKFFAACVLMSLTSGFEDVHTLIFTTGD